MMAAMKQVLLVAGAWIVLAGVFRGVGYLFRRVVRGRRAEIGEWHVDAWMGWAASIILLQIWHMFLPVDWRALATIGAIGLSGATAAIVASKDAAWRKPSRRAIATAMIFALAAVWLANHAVRQPVIRDSGLYHLNAIRWAAEYPIVPGLGNLHGRLAFNNSFFLYAAMLDVGPFAHKSHQLASGLLMLLVVWRCLQGAMHVLFGRGDEDTGHLYYTLFLAPVTVWCVASGYASSPSPDVAIYLLAIVTAGALIPWRQIAGRKHYSLIEVAVLAAVGVTVKLSFAVFAAAVCLAGRLSEQGESRRARLLTVVIGSVLGLSALLPWMVRGVILSGYPLYPVSRFGFPVDWRIDEHVLIAQADWIRSWARNPLATPAETLGSWSWLWPWINRVVSQHAFDVLIPSVLALLALLMRRSRALPASSRGVAVWVPVAVPVIGLAAWFFSAPDPRFAGSFFWVLAILLLVSGLAGINERALKIVVVVYSVVLVVQQVNPIHFFHTWKDPGVAKQVPLESRTTRSGLEVWVPKEGDQCWDGPLVCTPYFSPILELRDANDMSKGFKKRRPSASQVPLP